MPGRIVVALVAIVCFASTCHAGARLVAGAPAPALLGWLEFCDRHPAECTIDTSEPEFIALTAETAELVLAVNSYVNRSISPKLDEEHWGKIEQWDLPSDGQGDCEDYQLFKRKLLADAGLPRRALRMAVVLDDLDKGHAVLIVRTDAQDLVLDNKTNEVLRWDETGYGFVQLERADTSGWAFIEEGVDKVQIAAAQ